MKNRLKLQQLAKQSTLGVVALLVLSSVAVAFEIQDLAGSAVAPDEKEAVGQVTSEMGTITDPTSNTSALQNGGAGTMTGNGIAARIINGQAANTVERAVNKMQEKAEHYKDEAEQKCPYSLVGGVYGTVCLRHVGYWLFYSYKASQFSPGLGGFDPMKWDPGDFKCATSGECIPKPYQPNLADVPQNQPDNGEGTSKLKEGVKSSLIQGRKVDVNLKKIAATLPKFKSESEFKNYLKDKFGPGITDSELNHLEKDINKIVADASKSSKVGTHGAFDEAGGGFESMSGNLARLEALMRASRMNMEKLKRMGALRSALGRQPAAANGGVNGDGVNGDGVHGMKKMFNGEPIGVAGDDIFQIMNRRYLAYDRQNEFLSNQPAPRAP